MSSAATFADLVPAVETVDVRGTEFTLRGIGMRRCFDIIAQYPPVLALLSGKIDGAALIATAPDAAAALVAQAMGRPDDDALKQSFDDDLVLGEQLELVLAVIRATSPKGKAPFAALAAQFGLGDGAKILAASSGAASSNSSNATASPSPT